jgi:hypothetical protein
VFVPAGPDGSGDGKTAFEQVIAQISTLAAAGRAVNGSRSRRRATAFIFLPQKSTEHRDSSEKNFTAKSKKGGEEESSLKNVFDFFDCAVKTSSIPVVSQGFESTCFCPAAAVLVISREPVFLNSSSPAKPRIARPSAARRIRY